ncbi:UNVERIFIED_CONTAM: hypothetical protein K2H54_064272 [Gekko kuhli]
MDPHATLWSILLIGIRTLIMNLQEEEDTIARIGRERAILWRCYQTRQRACRDTTGESHKKEMQILVQNVVDPIKDAMEKLGNDNKEAMKIITEQFANSLQAIQKQASENALIKTTLCSVLVHLELFTNDAGEHSLLLAPVLP